MESLLPVVARSGVRSEGAAEVLQTLQPEAQRSNGNLPLGEGCERLAQMDFRLCLAGAASDVVHAAG
jgi:hypothetical protein